MPIEQFTKDVNNIQALSDTPTPGDMSAEELKARFDKAGADIKEYINGTIVPALNNLPGREDVDDAITTASTALAKATESDAKARSAMSTAEAAANAAGRKMDKHLLTITGGTIMDGATVCTHAYLKNLLEGGTAFVVLLYGTRAYHPQTVDNNVVEFISTDTNNGLIQVKYIALKSDNTVAITSAEAEKTANKSQVLDGSTTKYPSNKAVKDYVDSHGGTGGTTDYTQLSNKPSINGNALTGNKTAAQLGLATPSDIPSVDTTLTVSGQAADAKVVGDALEGKLSVSGGTMQGNIDMDGNSLNMTRDAIVAVEDDNLAIYNEQGKVILEAAGGVEIHNVAAPASATDAANKGYVDTAIATAIGAVDAVADAILEVL